MQSDFSTLEIAADYEQTKNCFETWSSQNGEETLLHPFIARCLYGFVSDRWRTGFKPEQMAGTDGDRETGYTG